MLPDASTTPVMTRAGHTARHAARAVVLATLWGGVALLGACSALSPPPVAAPAPVVLPPPPPPPAPPPPPPPEADPADAVARRLLAFHEHIRQLSPGDLAQEVTRLQGQVAATASAASPSLVLELALALGTQRNNGDLGRAISLLDPITKSTASELRPWQPVARLLQARFIEQRRLEELAERNAAQLRDAQRNVQQLNEKLEALKAIERSLNARPGASPAAPAPGRP